MWWLRRIAMAQRPCVFARSAAMRTARSTSHTPGSVRPFHTQAAGRSTRISGSPFVSMAPAAMSSR